MRDGAPIRVGLVIGQLTLGGAERQLYELALRLPSRGFEPHVYCLSEAVDPYGDCLEASGIAVTRMPRRRSLEWRRVRILARALRRDRITLVHAFLLIANAYGWCASRLARTPHFLPSVRAIEPDRSSWERLVDRIVLSRSPRVLVNARHLGGWVTERYGIPAGRIRVVHNGLDMARFAAVPPLPAIREGGAVVGSVFLFKKEKRVPFLLEVARRVVAERPATRFRLVGDGPERDEMLRLRDRMGLQSAVEMPGRSDDVAAELRRFDLFILTSAREGLPNAVIEAMASARPVVGSRITGIAEVVTEGEAGSLFPPDDPALAAEAVIALIDQPERASAMGRAARDSVERRMSVEAMVEGTVAVYREVLASRNGG